MTPPNTARLTFREPTRADAVFMLALLNSSGFIENIADRGIRTEAAAADYIDQRLLDSFRHNGFGMWIVTPIGEEEPVGLAGLVRRYVLEHVDVGYAFLERAFGRGYATEAAAAVLAHARKTLALDPVVAITTRGNAASQRVLEKVGLKYLGELNLPGWDGPSAYFST